MVKVLICQRDMGDYFIGNLKRSNLRPDCASKLHLCRFDMHTYLLICL